MTERSRYIAEGLSLLNKVEVGQARIKETLVLILAAFLGIFVDISQVTEYAISEYNYTSGI